MKAATCPVLDLAAAPVPTDRAKAWEYFRAGGDVSRLSNGDWCVTGVETVLRSILGLTKAALRGLRATPYRASSRPPVRHAKSSTG